MLTISDNQIANQRINDNNLLLTAFPIENIINKSIVYFCDGFTLYEASYSCKDNEEDDDEDKKTSIPVFIIDISYCDHSYLSDIKTRTKMMSMIEENNCANPYTLKRMGIYYDQNTNILSLIYSAKNKHLFMDYNCLNFITNEQDITLLNVEVFHNLCKIVQIEHDNNRAMSFIHPYLIFQEGNTIYTLDHAFAVLRQCIDLKTNFSICNYFGLFDIDSIDAITKAKEKNDALYLKPDILLLSAMLVYLLRINPTKSTKNFDFILLELSKDFYMKDKLKPFNKLYNIVKNNTFIGEVFLGILNTQYIKIGTVDKVLKQLNNHIPLFVTVNSKCLCDTRLMLDSNKDIMINIICIQCGRIQCPLCQIDTHHDCSNKQNKTVYLKESLKREYDKQRLRHESIPKLKDKRIIMDFKDTMKMIYKEFDERNSISLRKIKLEEKFIEQFTTFIEGIFRNYEKTKMDELMKDIKKILVDGNISLNSIGSITATNFFKRRLSNIQQSTTKTNENLDVNEKWLILSNDIDNFCTFIKDSSEMFHEVLYDRSLRQLIEVIIAKMKEYQMKIHDLFFNYYNQEVTDLLEEFINQYTNNDTKEISPDNIIKEYLYQESGESFYYSKYFIFYSDKITLYDTAIQKEVTVELEIEKENKGLVNMEAYEFGKNYRYLHLKTGVIITSGKGKKRTLMINYHKNLHQKYLINQLSDSLYIHEKHSMVQYNIFYILVLGGIKNKNCEMYNLVSREWINIPPLQSPIIDACVYLFNERFVYLFGGMVDANTFNKTIQILDMNKLDSWIEKEIIYGPNTIEEFHLCGILKDKNSNDGNKILILGGETITKKGANPFLITRIFNLEEYTLENTDQKCKMNLYDECLLLEIAPDKYNY